MQKTVLLDKLAGFVNNLKRTDNVGVLVHCDPDGLASGVVLATLVLKRTGKRPAMLACSPYGDHALMQKKLDLFRFSGCNKLLIADLSFDQDDFFVKQAESVLDALCFIDHHKVYSDLNSNKTVFIKAQFVSDVDPSQYPASKLCFDLFSKHADLDSVAWVVGVGILGDASGLQWKSFLDALSDKGFSFAELNDCKEVIEAVGLQEPFRFSELLYAFLDAKGPLDILNSGFSDLLSEMRSEIDFWLKKFQAEKTVVPELELVWFECHPRFPIKAPLVNKISFELHPNQTVIFIQDLKQSDSHVSVSARRQDGKVKMNDLLENAVKNIPNSQGGGHAPAAGGRVPREYLEQFKRNILVELEKQYSKNKK